MDNRKIIRSFNRLFLTLLISGFLTLSAFGQETLDETLKSLSMDAAQKYLNPISSAFGANLNGGWFHRAPKSKILGFDFELGIVGMGAKFPTDAKSFSTSGRFRFSEEEARQMVAGQGFPQEAENALVDQITSEYYNVTISGATIIGNPEDYITVGYPGKTYSYEGQTYSVPSTNIVLPIGGFKDLANTNWLPLGAPQLTIGTIFGTQATFRYLPSRELQEGLGTFKYFGFGIQHNPKIWLPLLLPVDFAVSFFTQKLEVGTLLTTTTNAFGINVSRQFGPRALNLTPYAGFMLENSKMEVTYNYVVQTPQGAVTEKIDFTLTGENRSRIILGMNIRFVLVNLNVDYNIGKYQSITAGLFLAI